MAYQGTAATLTLKDEDGRPTSRIFYVSYPRRARETAR
jgi:hypothetical protein